MSSLDQIINLSLDIIRTKREDLGFNSWFKDDLSREMLVIEPIAYRETGSDVDIPNIEDCTFQVNRKDVREVIIFPVEISAYLQENDKICEQISGIIAEYYTKKEQSILFRQIKEHYATRSSNNNLTDSLINEIIGYIGYLPTEIYSGRFQNISALFKLLTEYNIDSKKNIKMVNGLDSDELIFGIAKSTYVYFSSPNIIIRDNKVEIKSSYLIYKSPKRLTDFILFTKT